MLERFNPVLRLVCVALAGLVLYQLSQIALQRKALARSVIEAPAVTRKPAAETNEVREAKPTNAPPRGPRMPGMMPGMGGGTPLPPEVQATIDKIKVSQLLGPDIKPPPMALLGIAGKDVFFRAPNGQTGMIREGEEMGGVKLLKIGTNRILIEHENQQKELTIFSGFGSQTLMAPQKKDSSEPAP